MDKDISQMSLGELSVEAQKIELERVIKETRDGKNVTIRFGEALEQKEPRTIYITGVIDSPLRWLEKRKDIIDQKQCNIVVNRDDMDINLIMKEHDYYADRIEGRLLISSEFKKFGINSGEYTTGLQLSDLIRMNRSCFEDKKKAMELVTIMRNFKATVTTQLEMSDDKKGNTAQLRRQTVEGNQPPAFELCIPIFKGQPKVKFTVEIDIDPDTLQATLVSPDAQDMIAETRDSVMDNVLTQIQAICPEIPIIEV